MKQSIAFLCSVSFIMNVDAQVTASKNDFKILDNTNWEGTLTYIDYQSGKPIDVATTMQVKITENTMEQSIQYVWEPDKNVKAITKIKRNGKYIGKQKVVSKMHKEDGSVQIITTAKGKDDGIKATFYYTYEFDSSNYKVTKEVQFSNSDKRYMRNSYKYKILN